MTIETGEMEIDKNSYILYRACNHLSLMEKSLDDAINKVLVGKTACCVKHVS